MCGVSVKIKAFWTTLLPKLGLLKRHAQKVSLKDLFYDIMNFGWFKVCLNFD
jgi:hypothetical protein